MSLPPEKEGEEEKTCEEPTVALIPHPPGLLRGGREFESK